MIICLNDIGVYLQIVGIVVALSATRYLFHIFIVIQVIYENRKKIFRSIDFGHPETFSELLLMWRVNSKIWAMTFLKYLKQPLESLGREKILKSPLSNLMMLIGVVLVIVGLILTTTHFEDCISLW